MTGLPLDNHGRYTIRVEMGDPINGYKVYTPKYFPCAASACVASGKNLDNSDPATQAYVNALDAQVFKDINTSLTVAAVAAPVIVGGIAGILGPLTSLAAGATEGQFTTAEAKELLQYAVAQYLTRIYVLGSSAVTRITSLVDLSGGWQSFVDRAKSSLNKDKQ